jgi:DNA polymerase I
MDVLLHGQNPQSHIVGIHPVADNLMRLYIRDGDSTNTDDVEFFPFFFLADPSLLSGFPSKHWIKELEGANFYSHLCAFQKWGDMWDAVRHVLDRYNVSAATKASHYQNLPVLHLNPDPITQFLIQSGCTFFKGMAFRDLYRMQLDIETYFKPPIGRTRDERIILITLSDNRGWEDVVDSRKTPEKEMLKQLVSTIRKKDPDVIEGHNILGFDFPYIIRRCEALGVEFAVGRDGSPMTVAKERFASSPPQDQLTDIRGRNVIDTLLMLRAFDSSKRNLESYGLKYAARYFGVAEPDRTYLQGDRIWWHWENEPETTIKYAMEDVREVAKLSEMLSPSYFYLTQMIPMSYSAVTRSGSAAKIQSLMVREYVRQKHSIPKPQTGEQSVGGYADVFYTGIVGPVIYIDVESLYPSIMVSEDILPSSDALKTFPILLKELTSMRLDAKKRSRSEKDPGERNRWDAIQLSYKILINSFYGYLGYSRGLFNDFAQADRVARRGQEILRTVIAEVRRHGGKVIEVDTDGIFFVPPPDVTSEHQEESFVESVSKPLPAGIRLHVDGRYEKMLSYKKKNYAVLGFDGRVTIKGSSLISRSMEPFGRAFIERSITALLTGNFDELHNAYVETRASIVQHRFGAADLARTEMLRETREEYLRAVESGERNRSASYEAAIAAGRVWKPGARVSFYITGGRSDAAEFESARVTDEWDPNFPDENTSHYIKRLDEFAKKFEPFFFPEDFRRIFSFDDLFPFSSIGIGIITSPTQPSDEATRETDLAPGFGIWLDDESGNQE